jgi:hypothetical protein
MCFTRRRSLPLVNLISALILALCSFRAAEAQWDAGAVLRQVIQQLQTGTPNPQWYGTELWQVIALRTGGTGISPPLIQLGLVTNVVVTEQIPLPTGVLYAITAQHQNGTSIWVLGISTLTNKIEYADVSIGSTPQALPSRQPSTAPSISSQPNPPSNPVPSQTSSSSACQKFPNLC